MPFAKKDEDTIVVDVGLGFCGATADHILKEADDLPRDGRCVPLMPFGFRLHADEVSHSARGKFHYSEGPKGPSAATPSPPAYDAPGLCLGVFNRRSGVTTSEAAVAEDRGDP